MMPTTPRSWTPIEHWLWRRAYNLQLALECRAEERAYRRGVAG